MRTFLVLLTAAFVACQPAPMPPVHVADPAPPDPQLFALARSLGQAALRGDRSEVERHMMTFSDAASLSPHSRELGAKRWNHQVDDFFQDARDDGHHTQIVDAELAGARTLMPANDEVTAEVDTAQVQLVVETDLADGNRARQAPRGLRLTFLRTSAGWRLMPHP
jgi:hypothetical protein